MIDSEKMSRCGDGSFKRTVENKGHLSKCRDPMFIIRKHRLGEKNSLREMIFTGLKAN